MISQREPRTANSTIGLGTERLPPALIQRLNPIALDQAWQSEQAAGTPMSKATNIDAAPRGVAGNAMAPGRTTLKIW